MPLILDSHSLLWFADDDPQLPASAKLLIEDPNNTKYVSLMSIWEIAIKAASGKLKLKREAGVYLADVMAKNGFLLLNPTYDHAILAASLPLHHKDPFDRFLIAQSLHENMAIISADEIFDAYSVARIW